MLGPAPSGTSRQDYYPPIIDPYDEKHLVMAGHEQNYLVESTDGGQTWSAINLQAGSANYADLWIQPHFAVGIQSLNGSILGLSSNPRSARP